MRVCDLTTLYIDGGEGGVNTYLTEKARDFARRPGVGHLIIVPGARDERRVLFGTTVYTVKSRSLPSNPEHRVLTNVREVKRILRVERPDLVEVDCAYLLGQVARSALGDAVPIVGFYHVHLPTFIARPRASKFGSLFASTAERMTWRYVDYCNRYCDRVVVASVDIQQRLTNAGFTSPLAHIPLGVNLDLFRPRAERPDDPTRTILYVGRLSREKDLSTLIDAFGRLTPREHWRLRIVGDGPMRRDLERQARVARLADRIEFVGCCPYGEELAEHYRSADLLASPSPNETFNLTVLEGLASGLPVVAIRQGGPKSLVTDAVGALAAPNDPADLARCLSEVGHRDVDPAACRAVAEQQYPWSKTFDRLLEVYAGTLNVARHSA